MPDPITVSPSGRLDSSTAAAFDAQIRELLAEGTPALLIDFTQLDYISSAGLRVVLFAAKRLQAGGGKLVICGLSEPIAHVFKLSGFLMALNVVPDRAAALQAFAGADG